MRSEWQPINTLRTKLTSKHFMKSTIESELTLGQFRENNNLKPNRCNVFLELCDVERKNLEKIRDVILMKVYLMNLVMYRHPNSIIDAL